MSFLTELIAYVSTHGPTMVALISALLAVAELIVRLTPTEKDDGAVERIGHKVREGLDMLDRVFPNVKKGGGKHVKLKDKAKEPAE
jgi:midasin (ATPase involved in ribosome maturation)